MAVVLNIHLTLHSLHHTTNSSGVPQSTMLPPSLPRLKFFEKCLKVLFPAREQAAVSLLGDQSRNGSIVLCQKNQAKSLLGGGRFILCSEENNGNFWCMLREWLTCRLRGVTYYQRLTLSPQHTPMYEWKEPVSPQGSCGRTPVSSWLRARISHGYKHEYIGMLTSGHDMPFLILEH